MNFCQVQPSVTRAKKCAKYEALPPWKKNKIIEIIYLKIVKIRVKKINFSSSI